MEEWRINIYKEILKDYNTGDYKLKELSLKYGIKYDTISKNIRKLGAITNPHGKIYMNSTIFEKIDTEEKAYWLGFLYADGTVYKTGKNYYRFELGLAEKDLIHIEKFKKFVSSKHDIKYRFKTKSFRIAFNDPQFTKNLIDLGCVPNKSLILTFPTEEQVPLELQKHFIRGYFDGDGYLSKPPKGLTISLLGTNEFLNSILPYLFNNLDINKKCLKKDKRHLSNTYYFDLTGDNARCFLKHIYEDSNIFLNRKKELFDNINMNIYYKPVIQYDKEGNIIAEYYNTTEASKITNIPFSKIYAVCTGRYNHNSMYNFKYK